MAGTWVLHDDRAARRCASTLGLPLLGSASRSGEEGRKRVCGGSLIRSVVDVGLHVDEVTQIDRGNVRDLRYVWSWAWTAS